MKGWRPVCLSIGLETGSGLLRADSMPDIGSIGLSFSACPGAFALRTPAPFSRDEARSRQGRTETAPERPR
jgi:hypothetical protein